MFDPRTTGFRVAVGDFARNPKTPDTVRDHTLAVRLLRWTKSSMSGWTRHAGCSVNGFVALVVVYMVGQVQVEHPQNNLKHALNVEIQWMVLLPNP